MHQRAHCTRCEVLLIAAEGAQLLGKVAASNMFKHEAKDRRAVTLRNYVNVEELYDVLVLDVS